MKWSSSLGLAAMASLGLLRSGIAATGDENWDSAFGVPGANGPIWAITVRGQDVYIGGSFTQIGDISANNVARWNGTNWMALGDGLAGGVLPEIHAFAFHDEYLYVGGFFTQAGSVTTTGIARWDGTNWSGLNGGVSGGVRALVVTNDSPYVGGTFSSAGPITVQNIARWDGTKWASVGGNIVGAAVDSLAAGDGWVYAGGRFTAAGGVSAANIARWNGTNWYSLGNGIRANTGDGGGSAIVRALLVKGQDLYAGGGFRLAGEVGATNIARWAGTNWGQVGVGVDGAGEVYSLTGKGNDLYLGGYFGSAGGVTAKNIAVWRESFWTNLGTGTSTPTGAGSIRALAITGSEVIVGGFFTFAGGKPSNYIALWHIPHALNVERIGNQMRLSWPATGSNFVLEASVELPGTNWTEVPQSPVLVDDELVITNELDVPTRFYRLRKK